MKKTRRGRGEGGLYWDKNRQRFIAEVTVGYTPAGKRMVRRGSGKTVTEARAKLKQVMRDHEDGHVTKGQHVTVGKAAEDWLAYGLVGRSDITVEKYGYLVRGHIIPDLGARKLRALTAADVEKWLADKAKILSSSTVRRLHECLNRIIKRAMARELVKRNVVPLCEIPAGQNGRPSKSLTFEQAKAVLNAAEQDPFGAYVIVSLLTGARTEEMRELDWDHVDLDGKPDADPPVPPTIHVWRSVRAKGETKTRKSRRSLALPHRAVLALKRRKLQQAGGPHEEDRVKLVFRTRNSGYLDAANVRRSFRRILKAAGLDPDEWTPRELRTSFVSLLSAAGMRIEDIADLCGHAGTRVTEEVYRKQLRPVILEGATVMDGIFGEPDRISGA